MKISTGWLMPAVGNNLPAAITSKKNVRLNNLDRKMLTAQGNAQKFIDFSIDFVVIILLFWVGNQWGKGL